MTAAEYDFLAASFYRRTGVMAPGKDVAPGMSQPPREARESAWRDWLTSLSADEERERFQEDLRDAHAEHQNETSGVIDDDVRAEAAGEEW